MITTAPAATAISVAGNSPVASEVAGLQAQSLPARFETATLPIEVPVGFKVGGLVTAGDGSLRFTFGNEDGSAVTAEQLADLAVYATSDIAAPTWTRLEDALVIVDGKVQIVGPEAANGIRFYRVRRADAGTTSGSSTQ